MTEVQIFQILGLIYFAAGLGMMINPEFFKKMLANLAENSLALYIGAMLALALGYFMVSYFNVWSWDRSLIITLVGWFALVKGFFLLIFPQFALKLSIKFSEKHINTKGILVAVLGAVMIAFGFFRL